MARARGYHYVRTASGKKKRVYGRSGGRRRRSGGFKRVYGRGAYYSKKRPFNANYGRNLTISPNYKRKARTGVMSMIGFGGMDPPKMGMGKRGFTVEHREYIQDIGSSIPFIGEEFALNPGIATTFPWLAQIAENFEEYIPNSILFEYKTMSSNTVVNTTNSNPGLGTVIMATQYNSLAPSFGNKQQMENYENAVSCDPSRSMLHPVECAEKQSPVQPMYVRTNAIPNATAGQPSQDLRFFDLGRFTISTVGQQTNNFVIGELWVTYSFTFLKPKLLTGVGVNAFGVVDHFCLVASSVGQLGVNAVQPQLPFGNQTILVPPNEGSTLGGVISGGSVPTTAQNNILFPKSLGGQKPFPIFAIFGGNVQPTQVASLTNAYYFPPGISSGNFKITYLCRYTIAGPQSNQVVISTALTNLTIGKAFFNQGVDSQYSNNTTANTNTDMQVYIVTVLGNYASIRFQGTNGMSNAISCDVLVEQLPPALV